MAATAGEDEDGLISGINVTPLVDVILVLLIIFMVTARLIDRQAMPMDLPQAAQSEDVQMVFSVELSVDGSTRVNSEPVPNDDAISKLAVEQRKQNPDLRAVIRADKKVEHGRVIHVLDLLKSSGVAKIAFAVSPLAEPADVEAAPAPAGSAP